jgi:hypothetical protein
VAIVAVKLQGVGLTKPASQAYSDSRVLVPAESQSLSGQSHSEIRGSSDGGPIASRLTVIQSARLHEAEPFADLSDLLTKHAEGEALVRESLPGARVKRSPDKRLALGR